MESGLYLKFLSQLRINIAKKNLFFKISLNSQEIAMMRLLTQKGVIRRFFKLHNTTTDKELYIVYPNHSLADNSNLRLILFSNNADTIKLSLNALKLINTASGASSYILKTHKGLLTHQEAIQYRTGGVLVCLLY
jgi:ribosomal protein S8